MKLRYWNVFSEPTGMKNSAQLLIAIVGIKVTGEINKTQRLISFTDPWGL